MESHDDDVATSPAANADVTRSKKMVDSMEEGGKTGGKEDIKVCEHK